MKTKWMISLAVFSVLGLLATAQAGVIFTEDFEGYGVADGAFAGDLNILTNGGWTIGTNKGNLLNPAETGASAAWLNPVPAELDTTFAAIRQGGWFWRDLGVNIEANKVYTFSLTHFKRDDQAGDAIHMRLLADSATGGFVTDTFDAVTDNDTYVTRTITWDSGANASQNGKSLGILVFDSNGLAGGQVAIDNLTVSVIPEPATLGLVAAFGGGIIFIRRRIMM